MKWKAKPIPKDGDERWTLIFAWVPHRCSDGYWRWLCDLYVRQEYDSGWIHDGWLNLEYSASPEHVCGLQGFDPKRDDCPACASPPPPSTPPGHTQGSIRKAAGWAYAEGVSREEFLRRADLAYTVAEEEKPHV